MTTIHIRRTLDSDTLHLPELRPLIGRTVEIVVAVLPPAPAVRDQFYAEAGRIPDTEPEFEAQKEIFRAWRADARFEPYWPMLDNLITRDFATARRWAEALDAVRNLQDYDYDAIRDQDACDVQDQRRRWS
jgi:hypothetical protein